MWNVKCFVIPLITGTTGIVTKIGKEISGNNIGKGFIRDSVRRTSVLGTLHI